MSISAYKAKKVIVAGKSFPAMSDFLLPRLPDIVLKMVDQVELNEAIKTADVLIPAMSNIDADLLAGNKQLRLIQQWGAGLDGVDVKTATRLNIPVANVPTNETGNAESVAEWYIMAALSLCRKTKLT